MEQTFKPDLLHKKCAFYVALLSPWKPHLTPKTNMLLSLLSLRNLSVTGIIIPFIIIIIIIFVINQT